MFGGYDNGQQSQGQLQLADEPPLVMAATDDHDDDTHFQPFGSFSNNNNKEATAYLSRYEAMVRQQHAENLATMDHLRPCISRLERIMYGGASPSSATTTTTIGDMPPRSTTGHESVWERKVRFANLRMLQLEKHYQQGNKTKECMTTDRQLMLVLSEMVKQRQQTSSPSSNLDITWAELMQCYKTCIAGMQALEHLPSPSLERDRARHRTLAMLSMFDEASTQHMQQLAETNQRQQRQHTEEKKEQNDDAIATTDPLDSGLSHRSIPGFADLKDKKKKNQQFSVSGVPLCLLLTVTIVSVLVALGALVMLAMNGDSDLFLKGPTPLSTALTSYHHSGESKDTLTPPETVWSHKPTLVKEPTVSSFQPKSRVPTFQSPEPFAETSFPSPSAPMPSGSTRASSASTIPSSPSQAVASNDNKNNSVLKRSLVGALVGGPLMALAIHIQQAGTLAAAYAVGSNVLLGAGIASLVTAAVSLLKFVASKMNRNKTNNA